MSMLGAGIQETQEGNDSITSSLVWSHFYRDAGCIISFIPKNKPE